MFNRLLLSSGSSKIYAGGVANTDYVITTLIPLTNSTTNITHPAVGYTGTLEVYMAGTASKVGLYYSPDSKGAPQAAGQTAFFTYTCLGDETGFSIAQGSIDAESGVTPGASSPRAIFTVIGGVNNGRTLVVGSGANNNGWGAAGAPGNHAISSISTLLGNGATLVKQGAIRPFNSTIAYSDSTSFSAASNASYGDSQSTHTVGGLTLTLRNGTGIGGGMSYNSINYGFASIRTPSSVNAGNAQSRPALSQGAVILNFKNN